MTREVVLGGAVLSLALVGCGGGKQRPARHGSDQPTVIADKDVGQKAAEMPQYFALLSRKHGCAVDYRPDRAIADCHDEGVIGLGRKGTRVVVMCEGWMTRPQCERLFDAIAAEGRR